MPGTITPAQMFNHELNVVKGWPSPYAVDKTKSIKSGETLLIAGRVGHIDPVADAIAVGVPDAAGVSAPMPLFLWPNQTDFDVASDVGNISGDHIVALVATGGYELESTEFLAGTYDPGTQLVVHNTADADKGKLKVSAGIATAATVVGVISDKGIYTNEFRKDMIRFWPVYLPKR